MLGVVFELLIIQILNLKSMISYIFIDKRIKNIIICKAFIIKFKIISKNI